MTFTNTAIRWLDRLAPRLLARRMYTYLSNPNIRKLRDFEEAVLARAQQQRIQFKHFDIQCYRWGSPYRPVALLVHGWEGQAGNFGALVDDLLAKNYCVVAYDGPAHGKSSIAPTSMFDLAELVEQMIGLHHPQLIVSHSFGSVATLMGLAGHPEWRLERWLMVTTPHDFRERIAGVAAHFGVTERTVHHVIRRVEQDLGTSIDHMNMDAYREKVTNVQQALIVHSTSDRVIPISEARAAHRALPFSELIELEELGHYGILWSAALRQIVDDFVPDRTPVFS